MHSAAIVSILAVAGFAAAAPATLERRSGFFNCAANGFVGTCSVDPCALPWCPDFEHKTYTPVGSGTPSVTPDAPSPSTTVIVGTPAPRVGECAIGTGYFQRCERTGFQGCCKSSACDSSWCPDYVLGTYTPIGSVPPPVVAEDPSTSTTVVVSTPTPAPGPSNGVCPTGTGSFQRCGTNGFSGCCKSDACGGAWCPDYKVGTYQPAHTWEVRRSDPTVCPAGTGYFQSCSNGFSGCCKSDACGASWCADYKTGTYELKTPTGADKPVEKPADKPADKPVTPPTVANNDGVCAPGTGYFQVCNSGFKGCCKTDACAHGWCSF